MKAPVNDLLVTSPYGPRVLHGEEEFHDGIDFISSSGDARVFSMFDGVVCYDFDSYDVDKRWIDRKHSAGNMIIIKSEIKGEIYYIRYLHLENNFVKKGQKVNAGDIVGEYSDSGYSFGAHLHTDAYNEDWIKVDITLLIEEVLNAAAYV
jgi:murein DD-endopeptidase MepM/ murein hydrolase activator NlpD